MLQAFLADRFQLKFHSETREFQIYVLAAGKRGRRLTPIKSSATCASSGGGGKGGRARSGGTVRVEGTLPQSWENMVAVLSELADRRVIDKTGFDGNYSRSTGRIHWWL